MIVRIALGDATAEIDEGKWISRVSFLRSQCEAFTLMHPWRNVLSNPDPDHDVAQYVARKIGGGQLLSMQISLIS